MATNLNKTNRAEIIESVIRATDLGEQRTKILESARIVARRVVRDSLPPEFNALVAQATDPAWFPMQTEVWGSCHEHPRGILEREGYVHFDPVPVPARFPQYSDLRNTLVEALAPLTAQAKELVAREEKIRTDLMAYLLSCKTAEAAVKGMPELAKHVPAVAAPCYALVAPSNVLTELLAVGFKTEA